VGGREVGRPLDTQKAKLVFDPFLLCVNKRLNHRPQEVVFKQPGSVWQGLLFFFGDRVSLCISDGL
jgi:hypothetical protein